MNTTKDFVVQGRLPDFDRSTLHRETFPVNIRLYRDNEQFRKIITSIVEYLSWFLEQKWSNYDQARGVSTASLGIPWNIVGYWVNGEKKFLLNPKIIDHSVAVVSSYTNCSSFNLKNKIHISRYEWVTVRYFDLDGNYQLDEKISREKGGLTLQHEILQNHAETILDTYLAQGNSLDNLE